MLGSGPGNARSGLGTCEQASWRQLDQCLEEQIWSLHVSVAPAGEQSSYPHNPRGSGFPPEDHE